MTRIDIDFTRAEGAVLRLIGLVERKGFEVTGIDMPAANDAASGGAARLSLNVTPRDSGRRIEVLSRHVEKVHGVMEVRLQDEPSNPQGSQGRTDPSAPALSRGPARSEHGSPMRSEDRTDPGLKPGEGGSEEIVRRHDIEPPYLERAS
ncbi:MAG: ACT domain-containing protein [Oceanicaulis sp.]